MQADVTSESFIFIKIYSVWFINVGTFDDFLFWLNIIGGYPILHFLQHYNRKDIKKSVDFYILVGIDFLSQQNQV
jgi:hypothetical protein